MRTGPVDATLEAVVRRDRLVIVAALAAVIALSWAYPLAGAGAGMGMSAFETTRVAQLGMARGMSEGGMAGLEMMTRAVWTPGYAVLMNSEHSSPVKSQRFCVATRTLIFTRSFYTVWAESSQTPTRLIQPETDLGRRMNLFPILLQDLPEGAAQPGREAPAGGFPDGFGNSFCKEYRHANGEARIGPSLSVPFSEILMPSIPDFFFRRQSGCETQP